MGVCLIFESTDGDEAGGERGTESARRARGGEGKATLFMEALSFHGPSHDITPPPPDGQVLSLPSTSRPEPWAEAPEDVATLAQRWGRAMDPV